jgi:hypothetical protein
MCFGSHVVLNTATGTRGSGSRRGRSNGLGKAAEPVKGHELRGEDKLAFVTAYMSEPKLAKRVKAVLGVDPEKLSPDEFQLAIAEFPVLASNRVSDRYTGKRLLGHQRREAAPPCRREHDHQRSLIADYEPAPNSH